MERCPTCRARVRETTTCARCGTRLTRLLSIEASAMRHLDCALRHWQLGERALALKAIERSLNLKRDPLVLALCSYLLDCEAPPASNENPVFDSLWRPEPPDYPVPNLMNHP